MYIRQGYNNKAERLHICNYRCRLTPVGHEDFQSSILQQVASGKDSPDFCEQPFSMKTFCVGQNLESRKGKKKKRPKKEEVDSNGIMKKKKIGN